MTMTQETATVPCLFGCLASPGAKLPHSVPMAEKTLFLSHQDDFRLFLSGKIRELHFVENGSGCLAALGPLLDGGENRIKEWLAQPGKSALHSLLKSLRGNFIFIHYGEANSGPPDLFIATDRFGTRPAFHCQRGGMLYFSTHLHGLKTMLGKELGSICNDSLLHFYHFGITPGNRTLITGIEKIPPASWLHCTGGRVDVSSYADLHELYRPADFGKSSEEEIAKRIDELLGESVARRLGAGKEKAVALSGGVDSGFIAKILSQAKAEVKGLHLSYGDEYHELDRVNFLARNLGIKIERISADAEAIIDSLEKSAAACSEPPKFNDAAMRLLALAARDEGYTSLWDGDGADRLFFGMNRQIQYLRLLRWYRILKSVGLVPLVRRLLGMGNNKERRKAAILFANWQVGLPPYPERKMGQIRRYDGERERRLFFSAIAGYWSKYSHHFPQEDVILYFTYQSILMCPEMFFHAPAEIQNMLGMEPVSPYWDADLVSLALSIPSSLKIKHGKTKYILRRAASLGQEAHYWMQAKIGLQNAASFVMKSAAGQSWRRVMLEKVRTSGEFAWLSSVSPEPVNCDALIPLEAWKEAHGIG